MMKLMSFAGLTTIFLSGPVAAAGLLYDCDIANHERANGWISPKIAIILPGDNTVKIVDAITLTFAKEPVAGNILRDNAKRLVVKWTVEGVKADSGASFAGVNYRASLSKSTGKIEVSTIPKGYDTGLRAAGVCKSRNK